MLLDTKCEYEGYMNNAEYFADISSKYMKEKNYIYIVNDHVIKYEKIESKFLNGQRISTVNRGLNCYASYENVICMTSLNFDNEKQDLMTFIDGIDYEAQKRDGQMANDLQTIFRTALRDIIRKGCNNYIEINAIVPDFKTLQFLKAKMQLHFEVHSQMIDGFIPEKKKFDSTEYMREYRKNGSLDK